MVLTFGILCEAPDCVNKGRKKGLAATIFAGWPKTTNIGPSVSIHFVLMILIYLLIISVSLRYFALT